MLKKNISVQDISDVTDLSLEKVEFKLLYNSDELYVANFSDFVDEMKVKTKVMHK